MKDRSLLVVCACSLLALVGRGAIAQADLGSDDPVLIVPKPAQIKASPTMSGTLPEIFAQIEDQEEIRRAGLKANLLRRVQMIVPTVVIVEDASSYLYAISNWEGAVRFPILWDDGSVASREDIARFVRAFAPERVLRIEGEGDERWTGGRDQKEAVFNRALSKAVNEKKADWRKALEDLSDEGIVSPGIVVLDVEDKSWAAALALCAGRLAPAVFVTKPKSSVYSPLSSFDADTLELAIERGARATGRSWEAVGDDIDAITLALNTGTLIKTGPGARDRLSTTDRIGRREARGARWAWCGQIIGNESRGVYQAMCALFLSLDEGFVWDGYSQKQPWGQYDGTQAGEALTAAGLEVEVHDQPRYTLKDWKLRMVRPVGESRANAPDNREIALGSALLFLMNSKGASNVFDLPGVVDGQGKPGHMPMLEVPTALHIVHSFSLQSPMNRKTVGGRLLERGVFVYAGSVDEPFLGGFVPTPAIARRLGGTMAFAAAIHFDSGDAWKITVLGDPLVTLGPAGRRVDREIKIDGSIDIEQRAKHGLKDSDYLGGIIDLVMLGRDKSVARLAIALMKDMPEAFAPEVALVSIPSLFRRGEYTRMLDAYERLDAEGRKDPLMQDLLWLASPYLLARANSDFEERGRIEALLRSNIRKSQAIQDAEDLAMAMRKRSVDNAVGVLEALRPTLKGNQLKLLDRAIARVRR
jgi:hypothetical protein